MRILVTGSAGFLGSWLTETLLSLNHHVVGVDNFLGCYEDNVVQHPNYSFHRADVTDLEKMTELMQGCDVVIHCAATAVEGLSVFSPTLVTNNIVIGTTALATAAIRNKVKRFVNCSSMARYGDQKPPFTENMLPSPSDPYGVAKVAAEMQLDLLGKVHGFEVVHAVPHNIIGPRQRYNDPFRNVASIMTNLMLQGRQPIVYGDGNQVRCFSFVQDVLQVLVKLIDCDLQEHGEKFNVGPDEEFITINELASRLALLLNFNLHIDYHDMRPCEVQLAHCSSDKIRQRFNYKTTMTLDDGLQSIIDYIRNRGVEKFQYHLPIELHTDKLPRTWRDRLF
jgi:UDP-glucose 4-epimerase